MPIIVLGYTAVLWNASSSETHESGLTSLTQHQFRCERMRNSTAFVLVAMYPLQIPV